MNMMSRNDWKTYLILKEWIGQQKADIFKRECRKRASINRCETDKNNFRICFQNGCDGYCEKYLYKAHLTDEDKSNIENSIRIKRPYSAYDCTGKAFTSWISFFEVPNGTWCYHYISFDF